jgi:hypothetical protein
VEVRLTDEQGYEYPPAVSSEVAGSTVRFAPPQLGPGLFTITWTGPYAGSSTFSVDNTVQVESVGPSAEGDPVASAETSPGLLRVAAVTVLLLVAVVLLVKVRPRRLGVLAAAGPLMLAALVFAVTSEQSTAGSNRSVCLGYSGQERIDCLSDVAFLSFEQGGVSATLRELRSLASDARFVSEYGEHVCHTVAHQVARRVVAREGSIRRVVNASDTTCASGFLHGAVEGGATLVSTDTFTNEVRGLCAEIVDDSSLECVHGIGHGAALRFNSRIYEASDVCLELPLEPQVVQCILGVSMLSGTWLANMAPRAGSYLGASPPGVPPGSVGEPCLDARFTANPDRFKACLEGVVFYTKAGPDVLDLFPATWRSSYGIAAWCGEVGAQYPDLGAACFWGVGSSSALRIWEDPAGAVRPCLNVSPEFEESCVLAVVTQIRNNQTESPPKEVFEQVCAAASPAVAVKCREVSQLLVSRVNR